MPCFLLNPLSQRHPLKFFVLPPQIKMGGKWGGMKWGWVKRGNKSTIRGGGMALVISWQREGAGGGVKKGL